MLFVTVIYILRAKMCNGDKPRLPVVTVNRKFKNHDQTEEQML